MSLRMVFGLTMVVRVLGLIVIIRFRWCEKFRMMFDLIELLEVDVLLLCAVSGISSEWVIDSAVWILLMWWGNVMMVGIM